MARSGSVSFRAKLGKISRENPANSRFLKSPKTAGFLIPAQRR